jgi:hypothetical protein
MFQHPSGYQVEAKEEVIATALRSLGPLWPRGLRIGSVFSDVGHIMDDLRLLHRMGLIELRCVEPEDFGVCRDLLNRQESRFGDYVTSPYHTREAVPIAAGLNRLDARFAVHASSSGERTDRDETRRSSLP